MVDMNKVKLYKRGIQADPKNPMNYLKLSSFYDTKLYLPHIAEKYLKKLLQVTHGKYDCYYELYCVEDELGKYDEAIKCLEHAIASKPRNDQFYDELSQLYLQRNKGNDAKHAIYYVKKAINMNDNMYNKQYRFDAAKAELLLGNYKASLEQAQWICNDPFGNPVDTNKFTYMYNDRGLHLGGEHKDAEAIKCYRTALALDKDQAFYYNLARAYESLGKRQKAMQINKKALRQDPKSKVNNHMLNRLSHNKSKHSRRNSLIYDSNVNYSAKLDEMIGLKTVKSAIHTYLDRSMIHKIRRGKPGHGEIHLILEGNPGTGKSTVAKLLCAILYQKHIINKPHFVMVNSTQLVFRHYGESAQHVRNAIHRAMGGVLFIDEAYHLMHKSDNNSACEDEAVAELLPDIEKYRNKLVVIMAGYPHLMEKFLNKSNPGLGSRFPDRIKFPDYNNQDCRKIMKHYLDENHFHLANHNTKLLLDKDLNDYLTTNRSDTHHVFSNARTVRNVYTKVTDAFADRLMTKYTRTQLYSYKKHNYKLLDTITAADVKRAFNKYTSRRTNKSASQQLHDLIGLQPVKSIITSAVNQVLIHEIRTGKRQHASMNMVFEGNPGTGKTTVAKLFCKILYEKGVTKSDNYVYVSAASLSGKLVGESAENMRKVIKRSLNGVLFIDEAYELADRYNEPIISQLISSISKYKNKLIVILAGYPRSMEELMTQTNSGLSSRFPKRVRFPDYTTEECRKILYYNFDRADLNVRSSKVKKALISNFDWYINTMRDHRSKFANGRTVNNYFDALKQSFANRLGKYSIDELKRLKKRKSAKLNTIELADVKVTSKRLHKQIAKIGVPKIGFQAAKYRSNISLNN